MNTTTFVRILLFAFISISAIPFITAQKSISIGIEMDSSQAMLLGTSTDSLGNKLFWYPRKSIFLAGTGIAFDEPNKWEIDSIGVFSTSFGVANEPYGIGSMSWGLVNTIDKHATFSTVFGSDNYIAEDVEYGTAWGTSNVIRKSRGTAWGTSNKIIAENGTAFGRGNSIFGEVSTVFGELNLALNSHTTIGGFANISNGKYSTAFGLGLQTHGAASAVFGLFNDTTLIAINNNDIVTTNSPLMIVGNGTSFNKRSNAFSVFANGFVKIGNGTPASDLHIKQSANDDNVTSAGIRLESKGNNDYWQIYSSGDKLSFGRFGVQVAYIDEDGSFVENNMLLKEEEGIISLLKSNNIPDLVKMNFQLSRDSQQNEKIRIDSNSLKKDFPQFLKYDLENSPVAIDKNQLLILALAKLKEHEKVILELSSIIKEQEKKITIIQSRME
jgi:hypothetical protein